MHGYHPDSLTCLQWILFETLPKLFFYLLYDYTDNSLKSFEIYMFLETVFNIYNT